jgi:DNA-binding CsgD family transcriptional regulator
MKRIILLYSLALAVLVFLLKWLEYSFLVRDLSLEFYIGLIAILFTALGSWLAVRLTRRKVITVTVPATAPAFQLNPDLLQQTGISKREHEVLELMAQGLSNQEIADKLFLSPNTVKTHLSNLFIKLDVKRRTQAIQKAKERQLIP